MKRRAKVKIRIFIMVFAALLLWKPARAGANSWFQKDPARQTAENEKEFIRAVYEGMLAGKEKITVLYMGRDYKKIHETFLNKLLPEILQIDDPNTSDDCDYMSYNLDEIGIRTKEDFLNLVTITITPKWKESKEETKIVNERVREILAQLQLSEDSDYDKIKKIHDYIVTHFSYDETLKNYTVFDGMQNGSMICQGYMLLTYKLLSEAGVPVKCVDGIGSNSYGTQTHGWNLVKLSGFWYNLDTTWDDPVLVGGEEGDPEDTPVFYDYFLKGNLSFAGDHERSEEFLSGEFCERYPVSSEDYEEGKVNSELKGVVNAPKVIVLGEDQDTEEAPLTAGDNLRISIICYGILFAAALFLKRNHK